MEDFKQRITKMSLIVFVILFVIFGITIASAQSTNPTVTPSDCIGKTYIECLGLEDKTVFPFSGYQKYFEEQGATKEAYDLTVRRIIYDLAFFATSGLLIAFFAILLYATFERITGGDNEEKIKKAKKRINAATWGLLIVVIFTTVLQFLAVITGIGNIWEIKFIN